VNACRSDSSCTFYLFFCYALVGISTTGAVIFISKLWGGSASDVEITRRSGLIDMLDSRDAVMVDKGFTHIKSDLSKKGVQLYCPPFKTKEQFTKEEVECTRRIASARIHVERKGFDSLKMKVSAQIFQYNPR
jgi:hypothetical protein